MGRRSRSDVLILITILLLIGAVGSVAATIDSVQSGESGAQGERSDVIGVGANSTGDVEATGADGATGRSARGVDLQFCIDVLRTGPAMLGICLGVAAILVGVKRLYSSSTAILASTGVIPVVLFGYFVLTNCPGASSNSDGLLSGSEAFGATGTVGTAPSVPPGVLGAVIGAVMLAAVAVLFVVTGSDQSFEETETEDRADFDADGEAIAVTAGRAADRIEESDVPVDNAVYEAWREMTRLLDMEDRETAPPAAFAERAIEAGFDERTVSELTDLFRDVRYGGKDAESRESRAVEILREIEHADPTDANDPECDESGAGGVER